MALSATSKPNNTIDEWIEAAVALIFCLACVGVGMAVSEWPTMTAPILIATVTAYLPIAVWLTKRRRARGIRRFF
jgi:hypothetical protein